MTSTLDADRAFLAEEAGWKFYKDDPEFAPFWRKEGEIGRVDPADCISKGQWMEWIEEWRESRKKMVGTPRMYPDDCNRLDHMIADEDFRAQEIARWKREVRDGE